MKLNHMICPHCEHDFFTSDSYATCDSCYTFFYASESLTNKRRVNVIPRPTIYPGPTIIPGPTIVPMPDWPQLTPWGEWVQPFQAPMTSPPLGGFTQTCTAVGA